jgi:transcription initiation factor TFIIIB Brf1 subunit/transcription initiation factor TFIIB
MDEIEAYEEEQIEQESDEETVECLHSQVSDVEGSTICVDCGIKLSEELLDNENRYYGVSDTRYIKDPSRHNQRKIEDRSLYGDLEPLGFPKEIIERANNYYTEIIKNKIYRAGNRKSIVFACTYHAYGDIQEPRVPSELATKFNLDKKGVSNGLKTFSNVFRKRPGKKYIDAIDLVPKILTDLNIERSKHKSCKEDIEKIYNFVQSKTKTFSSSNPQSIAAGIVYYYLKLNKVLISRSEFAKIVNLTDITFTKIATDIHKVINSNDELKF